MIPENRSVKPPLRAFNFLYSARRGNGNAATINNVRDPSCSHGYSCRASVFSSRTWADPRPDRRLIFTIYRDSCFNYKNKAGIMKPDGICTGSVARASRTSCRTRQNRQCRIHTASRLANYADIQTNEKNNTNSVSYTGFLLLHSQVVETKAGITQVKSRLFYSAHVHWYQVKLLLFSDDPLADWKFVTTNLNRRSLNLFLKNFHQSTFEALWFMRPSQLSLIDSSRAVCGQFSTYSQLSNPVRISCAETGPVIDDVIDTQAPLLSRSPGHMMAIILGVRELMQFQTGVAV